MKKPKSLDIIKNLLITSIVILSLTNCKSVKLIGNINVISSKNVKLNKETYITLSSNELGTKKELRRSKSKSIEEAVNECVKQVPGGIFIENAKIYRIGGIYYAVEGDVLGIKGVKKEVQGISIGDKVIFRRNGKHIKSTVVGFKGTEHVIIKLESGKMTKVKLAKVIKAK